MTEKPYRLPDPEKEPAAFLVILYKTLKRIEFNDRAWDKVYFARCMKRTGELLEALKYDVHAAARCMQDVKAKLEGDGLNWTIETIVQYCFEWRAEHSNRSERDCLTDLAKAYAGKPMEKVLLPPPAPVLQVREPDPVVSEEERQGALKVLANCKKILKHSRTGVITHGNNGADSERVA